MSGAREKSQMGITHPPNELLRIPITNHPITSHNPNPHHFPIQTRRRPNLHTSRHMLFIVLSTLNTNATSHLKTRILYNILMLHPTPKYSIPIPLRALLYHISQPMVSYGMLEMC